MFAGDSVSPVDTRQTPRIDWASRTHTFTKDSLPMKLKTPVVLEVTDQQVMGARLDRSSGRMIVTVAMISKQGSIVFQGDVAIEASTKVQKTDADGIVTNTFEGGRCQRIVVKDKPAGPWDVFALESFVSENAFVNARTTTKLDDEMAALEAAGVADGWLLA